MKRGALSLVFVSASIRFYPIYLLSCSDFRDSLLFFFATVPQILINQSIKYDNGGRFDLRLPYADQGYVDEDADVMGKIAGFFGGNKKKEEAAKAAAAAAAAEEAAKKKKKGGWPW